jgi:hypothetical protein
VHHFSCFYVELERSISEGWQIRTLHFVNTKIEFCLYSSLILAYKGIKVKLLKEIYAPSYLVLKQNISKGDLYNFCPEL